MRLEVLILLFILSSSLVSAADCIWSTDVSLATDVSCVDGFASTRAGLHLNCNGHTIRGDKTGTALLVRHDNIIVQNCNVAEVFTGIAVEGAVNTLIRNVYITNASTGLSIESANGVTLENIKVENTTYYDLYTKSTKGLKQFNVNLKNHTSIDDERLPDPLVEADPKNYTFITEPMLVAHPLTRVLADEANVSFDDLFYAASIVHANMTVVQTEGGAQYAISITPRSYVQNLQVAVFLPTDFTSYHFVRAQGGSFAALERKVVFPEYTGNESLVLSWEVTTDVPNAEVKLPMLLVAAKQPLRPSEQVAHRLLLLLFLLSAVLFVTTKKFLLKEPVTLKEQSVLLLAVLALWALTYKFTITALQFAKDFVLLVFLVALTLYYFGYVFKHRKALENL